MDPFGRTIQAFPYNKALSVQNSALSGSFAAFSQLQSKLYLLPRGQGKVEAFDLGSGVWYPIGDF